MIERSGSLPSNTSEKDAPLNRLQLRTEAESTIIIDFLKGHISPLRQLPKTAFTTDNDTIASLYDMIMANNYKKDRLCGIKSCYVATEGGSYLYLRDARTINDKVDGCDLNSKRYPYDFSNRILVCFMAFVRLCERYGLKQDPEILKDAEDFVKTHLSAQNKEEVRRDVVEKLVIKFDYLMNGKEKFSLNDIIDILNGANLWAVMEVPSLSMVTLKSCQASSGEMKVIITHNTPVTALDANAKQLIVTSKANWDSYECLDDKQKMHVEFYRVLKPHERKLFDYYMKKLLTDEDRLIPSQLRGKIPLGNKNHYQNRIIAVEVYDDKPRLNVISNYYRSGTVVFANNDVSEDARLHYTKLALTQQKNTIGTERLHFMSLNARVLDLLLKVYNPIIGDNVPLVDKIIVENTIAAGIQLKDVFTSNLCLNGERQYFKPDLDVIIKLFKKLSTTLSPIIQQQILQKKHGNKQQLKQFNLFLNMLSALNKILADWDELKKIDSSYNLVPEVTLGGYVNLTIHHYNECALSLRKTNPLRTATKTLASGEGCVSGINRTLEICFHSDFIAKFHHLNPGTAIFDYTAISASSKNLLVNTARTFHYQLISGWSGNIPGTDGLRRKSIGSIPAYYPNEVGILLAGEKGGAKPADQKVLNIDITRLEEMFTLKINAIKKTLLCHHKVALYTKILSLIRQHNNAKENPNHVTFTAIRRFLNKQKLNNGELKRELNEIICPNYSTPSPYENNINLIVAKIYEKIIISSVLDRIYEFFNPEKCWKITQTLTKLTSVIFGKNDDISSELFTADEFITIFNESPDLKECFLEFMELQMLQKCNYKREDLTLDVVWSKSQKIHYLKVNFRDVRNANQFSNYLTRRGMAREYYQTPKREESEVNKKKVYYFVLSSEQTCDLVKLDPTACANHSNTTYQRPA